MRRRMSAWLAALVIPLLVIGLGASGQATAAAVTPGGTLTIAVLEEASGLDPQISFSTVDSAVIDLIFDRLFVYDRQNRLKPLLAKTWENPDLLTWTIEIRSGAKFHNGREIVAEDVRYTFNRLMDPNVGVRRRRLSMMDKVEVVDKYKVKVTLSNPYPPFLHILAQTVLGIVPKEEVDRLGADFNIKPVGSGPFKLTEWRKGDRIVLVRNDQYWLKKPNVDRLIFRTVPEPSVQLVELLSGNVDMVSFVPPDDLPRLRNNPNIQIGTVREATYTFLGFNVAQDTLNAKKTAPFKDLRVRQAIYHAVDWNAVVKAATVHPEYGERSFGIIPSSVHFYNQASKAMALPFDPKKAKELLAQAGYPNGFTAELITWNKLHEKAGLIIQSYLREVGIKVDVKFLVLSAWVALVNTGEFEFYLANRSGMVDPDEYLFEQFHSANWGARGNRMRYKNTQVDTLVENGQKEINVQRRLRFYRDAERLVLQDIPQIPIMTMGRVMAWNKRIQDAFAHPQQGAFPVVSVDNNVWIRP